MIDQEDKRLKENLRKYGCYFLSLLAAVCKPEVLNNPVEINKLYKKYVDLEWLGPDCTVLDAAAILSDQGRKVVQRLTPSGSIFLPVSEIVTDGVEILAYTWPEKRFTHFALGDGAGRLVYDPIHRGANTIKFGALTSKRIFDYVQ